MARPTLLRHVSLFTRDLARSVEWYSNVLELAKPVVGAGGFAARRAALMTSGPELGCNVKLVADPEWAAATDDSGGGGGDSGPFSEELPHLTVAVSNLKTTLRKVRRFKGTAGERREVHDEVAAEWGAVSRDCDGRPLQLLHKFNRNTVMYVTVPAVDAAESTEFYARCLGLGRLAGYAGPRTILGNHPLHTASALVIDARHPPPGAEDDTRTLTLAVEDVALARAAVVAVSGEGAVLDDPDRRAFLCMDPAGTSLEVVPHHEVE